MGKAKNLDHRLRSYSHLKRLLPKTAALVAEAAAVKYEVLESELTALLVEAELIRLHQPHYNILLKDDKTPLYIITTKETYPKVLSVRKTDLTEYRIKRSFGPFPSGRQVRAVLSLARRLFPYCTASAADKAAHKACLYSHIGLCPGACAGRITPLDYADNIHHLEQFLQGKHREVVRELTIQLNQAAAQLDYETAHQLKTKIEAIDYVVSHYRQRFDDQPIPNLAEDEHAQESLELFRFLTQHHLSLDKLNRIEAYDVANIQGKAAAVSMVVATNGVVDHSEYRHFAIKTLNTPNDVGMLKEALSRRQHHPEWGIPDLIVVDGGKPQTKAVKSIMTWSVPVIGLAKMPDRLLIPSRQPPYTWKEIPIRLPQARLLVALRDEAHRFARRLHHHRAKYDMFNA